MVRKLYKITIGNDVFEIPKVNSEQDGLLKSDDFKKILFFEETDNIFEELNSDNNKERVVSTNNNIHITKL